MARLRCVCSVRRIHGMMGIHWVAWRCVRVTDSLRGSVKNVALRMWRNVVSMRCVDRLIEEAWRPASVLVVDGRIACWRCWRVHWDRIHGSHRAGMRIW
jgi:hypothetical protein